MAHKDASIPPLRTGLSLQAVIEEYLQHGCLRSTAAFGFAPDQSLQELVAGDFKHAAMRPAAYEQIERDVLLRHRGGVVPASLRSTYLRGRYLNSELDLLPGPPLATILRWLSRRRPAPRVELFETFNAEYGAVLVDRSVKFCFTRNGDRYRVTSLMPRIVGSGDDRVALEELDCTLVGMQPCERSADWLARAAQNPKGRQRRAALRAVEGIATLLPP
ncbi:hypothetical protein RDV84_13305 [Lysobacter yananisis]|uniref:VTC domain-containing protein n=1 Tax=Lysobacter yananisis TaxID=1003114 RepID=A0ABY9P212_9GAMM|nr:hypothetical protein [Lysobacter yananisis]WMT00992.1 hypothetical protein RDV84_13305 [Lysobacter yananisis]